MLWCQAARQSRAAKAESFSLDLAPSVHTQAERDAWGGMETESASLPLCLRGRLPGCSTTDQKKKKIKKNQLQSSLSSVPILLLWLLRF